MRRTTRKSWFVIGILALALSAAACGDKGGGGGGTSGLDGADSPEALIELARPFADKQDLGSLIGVIAPQDRPVMAFMGLFMAKMMPQMLEMAAEFSPDEAGKKEAGEKLEGMKAGLAAVMKKHGVDLAKVDSPEVQGMMGGGEPEPSKVRSFMQANFPNLNPGPFMSDVFAVVTEFGDPKQAEAMTQGFKGKLENLEVTGDTAKGTIDGNPIGFVREGGRWYISISESKK